MSDIGQRDAVPSLTCNAHLSMLEHPIYIYIYIYRQLVLQCHDRMIDLRALCGCIGTSLCSVDVVPHPQSPYRATGQIVEMWQRKIWKNANKMMN